LALRDVLKEPRILACVGNRSFFPRSGKFAIGHGHLLAVTILICPNRSTLAISTSAQHPVAARLIVGPADVRDVDMGHERYDAITPSGNAVGLEVDGGHCKSFCSTSRPKIAKWIVPKVEGIRRRIVLIFALGVFPNPLSMRMWL
jgi:hypothetical protein